ncbi:MAG: gluconeogenesis factor YvcK family protein [Cellulosilyticaceae bacterium]
MNNNPSGIKVVAIGGGTGLSTMIRGLKQYTSNITAIVTVSDNGGGSGKLRQEMNIAPPGDIRNCLVALANTEPIMEKLLQYRFKEGTLKGQNFGNLFLAALTDVSGCFEKAVQVTSNVLAITGKVLPVTLEDVDLYATFENGECVIGETEIVEYSKQNQLMIKEIVLKPSNPEPAQEVIQAIKDAEVIILGPGSLYTSIIPNLLVSKVGNAISESNARKIYIANLMSQPGETTGFTVEDHIHAIEKYIGKEVIDTTIVNNEEVPQEYMQKYIEEGAHILQINQEDKIWQRVKRIEVPLVKIERDKTYVRHDSYELAKYIFQDIKR